MTGVGFLRQQIPEMVRCKTEQELSQMNRKVRDKLRKNQRNAKRRERRALQRQAGPMTPEVLLERFGRYLAQRRIEKRLSLRQFALACDMPFTNVFQYERSGKNPRLTELDMIARVFDEPLVEFLKPLFSQKEFPPLAEKRVLVKAVPPPPSEAAAAVTVV